MRGCQAISPKGSWNITKRTYDVVRFVKLPWRTESSPRPEEETHESKDYAEGAGHDAKRFKISSKKAQADDNEANDMTVKEKRNSLDLSCDLPPKTKKFRMNKNAKVFLPSTKKSPTLTKLTLTSRWSWVWSLKPLPDDQRKRKKGPRQTSVTMKLIARDALDAVYVEL